SDCDGDRKRNHAENDRHTGGFKEHAAIIPHDMPAAFTNGGCNKLRRASIYSFRSFGGFWVAIEFRASRDGVEGLLLFIPDAVFAINPLQFSITNHRDERCVDFLDESGLPFARIDHVVSLAHWFADESQ